MDVSETLIGLAEIAVALAGFTGVVVAFGSRSQGAWHAGDRLRLAFLLEASLSAAGFALLGLLLFSTQLSSAVAWSLSSLAWSAYMLLSLFTARQAIKRNHTEHGDVDRWSNRITGMVFMLMIAAQICNALWWQEFAPFLAAVILNLVGAAMQFARLIRSAFQG